MLLKSSLRKSLDIYCFYLFAGTKEDYLKQMNIKAILDFFIKTEVIETNQQLCLKCYYNILAPISVGHKNIDHLDPRMLWYFLLSLIC